MNKIFLLISCLGFAGATLLTAQNTASPIVDSVASQIYRNESLARDLTSFYVLENTDEAETLVGGLTARFPHLVCSIVQGAIDGYPEIDNETMVNLIKAAVTADPSVAESLADCLSENNPAQEVLIRTAVAEALEALPTPEDFEQNLPLDEIDSDLVGPATDPAPPPPPPPPPPTTTPPVPPAPVPSPN